jgi:hypothetical protein
MRQDAWVAPPYHARLFSVPRHHWSAGWFFLDGDRDRMRQAMKLTSSIPSDNMLPWNWISDLAYTQALQATM